MAATAKILHVVPMAEPPRIISAEQENGFRERIHCAELASMATEAERIKAGKRLFDGPLARARQPLTPIAGYKDRHLGPGEVVELWGGNVIKPHSLVMGETKYLRWRRQWAIFPVIAGELRAMGLPEDQVQEVLYELFDYGYGVMGDCKMMFRGDSWTLCVIRGEALDTKGVGQMSLAAGTVKPFETAETALRREVFHETSVRRGALEQGWVRYDFPDVPSFTLGRRMAVQANNAMPIGNCFEAQGKRHVWQRTPEIAGFLAGDKPTRLLRRFREAGVNIAKPSRKCEPTLEMTGDGRQVFSDFLGICD